MDWSRLRRHSPNNNGGGFSLVEVIVSVVLLAVFTVAIMSVFNSSISTMRSSTELDATAAAISADLAVIERMNDYYSCPTGSCSVGNLSNAPPNKYEYAPSASDAAASTAFLALCTNNPANLSVELVNTIGASATITANNGISPIAISRTAKLHPDNGVNRYLYIVEWTPPMGAKRQIILSPTVAQWCP